MRNIKTTLAYVVLVAFLAFNQVDCQCVDLIQQYFQCKYLKMISNIDYNSNNYSSLPAYIPDPSIANNQLNETFYQSQNLSKMTFDQAMQFFWKIYNETNNCNSSFCVCVSKGVIDKWGQKWSLLFRNNSIFTQMKIILSAFNSNYKPVLLPYSQLTYQFYQTQNLTTLNQFCVNYDYSYNRIGYYNSTKIYSCYQNLDAGVYFSCQWAIEVVNKKRTVNLTNSQLANLLSCNLIPFKKCPSQHKRFYALSTWYSEYPAMTFPWKNIPAYLDTLISRADSYKPKITFAYSYFGTYLSSLSTYYNNTFHSYDFTNKTDFTAVAFNSTQLRIDCHFNISNGQANIEWYNLTYIYDKTHSYNLFIHTSIIYPINAYFSNGTIIKDKNNQNWIQIFYNTYYSDQYSSGYQYVFIYDFYANSYINFGSSSLSLYAHITMYPKANGFMINGLK